METWRITVLLIAVLVLILLVFIATRICLKDFEKRLFIYPKTGNRYVPLYRCKLKSPTTGDWHDAILYKSLEDGTMYVRERQDFFDKFVSNRVKYGKN